MQAQSETPPEDFDYAEAKRLTEAAMESETRVEYRVVGKRRKQTVVLDPAEQKSK